MGQFTHNGVVYEELPDGNVRVVGYEQRQAVGPNSLRVEQAQTELEAKRASMANEAERLRIAREAAELDRLRAGVTLREGDAKRNTMEARGGVDSTESERTAAFLATRVAGGLQDLGRIGKIGAPTLKDALVGGTLLGNYTTDEDRQRTIAAQREILDAALTLGTGAAYTGEQIESYRASYFPQPGDKPETVKDKSVRLQRLLEASRLKAGASASMIDDALNLSTKDANGLVGSVTDDRPNENGSLEVRVTDDTPSPFDPRPGGPQTAFQDSYVGQGMSGLNEGLASVLGAPVDLATMGMNLGSRGINAVANTDIPQIERPFLGSEMIGDNMRSLGATYAQSDDPSKRFTRRATQSLGAAAVPVASTPSSLAKALQALGVAGGGGIGAAAAQQAFPNNVAAEFAGEVLGSGLSAASLAKASRLAATKRAIQQVPSRDELRDQASNLYSLAESRGIVAGPNVTGNIAGRLGQIADDEKLRWPNGKVDPNYTRAGASLDMMDAHNGQSIDPRQIQVLRRNLSDAVQGSEGNERRIARQMLKAFDDETVPLAPELAQARKTSSRYLQSDEITRARELAEPRAAQYSGSGMENALRTEFRKLDRNLIDDPSGFNPAAADAIRNVTRGDKLTNALRVVGKAAPTGVVSGGISAGVPFAIGNTLGGPGVGAAASAATMGIGTLARNLASRRTQKGAEMADVLARNGGPLKIDPLLTPEDEALLRRLLAGQATQYIPR